MKPKLLVNPYHGRTIDNPAEVERLLSQGWLLAAPKPRTKDAGRMRTLRTRRRAEGWVNLTIWVNPEQYAAISAAKKSGESVVGLIMRMIKEQGSVHGKA